MLIRHDAKYAPQHGIHVAPGNPFHYPLLSYRRGEGMAVPGFQELMRPLLALGQNGEVDMRSAIQQLANDFNLSEADRAERLPSGQTVLYNRAYWARTYLTRAGALRATKKGHFEITDRGRLLLQQNPNQIRVKQLKAFPEFLQFHAGTSSTEAAPVAVPDETSQETPEELVLQGINQINQKLKEQILEHVLNSAPDFFERIVIDLIVAMGYGGSRADAAKKLGRTGDEGVDGVVNEDPLGLDVVYLQAKRYAPENIIGREKIQQFSGALVGQGAHKRVFVTTSSFSAQAKQFVQKIPQRLILIDGDELTNLMLRYGVGVRTEQTIDIKRIDTDYFDLDDA